MRSNIERARPPRRAALEHRKSEASSTGRVALYNRWKLSMVANQRRLLNATAEWHERFRFRSLSSLVH